MNITLSGSDALTVKYAIALARRQLPELVELSDEEVLSRLIEIGVKAGEVRS